MSELSTDLSSLVDLRVSYDTLLEELKFIQGELNDPDAWADPGYYSDLRADEESVSAELDKLSNEIAAIVAKFRRGAVGHR